MDVNKTGPGGLEKRGDRRAATKKSVAVAPSGLLGARLERL
jgi:hypothetical protein